MWELMLAALLLFVLVGPKKLPEVAKTLAQALAKLRRSVDEMKKEVDLDEELDFIKEVRNLSPEKLFEDADLGKEMKPVDLPKGPQKKVRKKGQRKPQVKEPASGRTTGRKQIKPGQTRRQENGKRQVERKQAETKEPLEKQMETKEVMLKEDMLSDSESRVETGTDETLSAVAEKPNTKQTPASGKRIMIKPGKTD